MRSAAPTCAATLAALLASCGGGAEQGTSASGGAPDAEGGEPWFVEEARARGLVFEHRSGQGEGYLYPEIVCGGGALLDMEGDGDLDEWVVESRFLGQEADRRTKTSPRAPE
jgi:hypothetical protein